MNALVTQLLTLIGVIVGVVATFIATNFGARAQWNREQRTRTEDRKLDACVAFVDASSQVLDLSERLARTRGLPISSGPIPLDAGIDQLTQAATKRSQCWYRLQLVGDPAIVSAGQEWLQASWDFEKFAIGDLTEPEKFMETEARTDQARENFYEAVRHSLGKPERTLTVKHGLGTVNNPSIRADRAADLTRGRRLYACPRSGGLPRSTA